MKTMQEIGKLKIFSSYKEIFSPSQAFWKKLLILGKILAAVKRGTTA